MQIIKTLPYSERVALTALLQDAQGHLSSDAVEAALEGGARRQRSKAALARLECFY
ncbi:MAG: hypothetical protein ABI700_06400 [Chloroflexota bacterium]